MYGLPAPMALNTVLAIGALLDACAVPEAKKIWNPFKT